MQEMDLLLLLGLHAVWDHWCTAVLNMHSMLLVSCVWIWWEVAGFHQTSRTWNLENETFCLLNVVECCLFPCSSLHFFLLFTLVMWYSKAITSPRGGRVLSFLALFYYFSAFFSPVRQTSFVTTWLTAEISGAARIKLQTGVTGLKEAW